MVGHEIWQETVKNVKYGKYTSLDLDCGKKTDKHGNLYTNIVLSEIYQEILKNVKNGNALCRTWNMARKLKNVEIERQTLQDMEYGENTDI
jgi:hypothetical protein